MKSAVETLSPTRAKLTVEVPFEELKTSLDAAYKKISQQINVPGFRRGKVPAMVIDRQIGRPAVLDQAINEALPSLYVQALEDNDLKPLAQPEIDITRFEDHQSLEFTAEVDVRPEIDLPDYAGLEVTVGDAQVTDAEVEARVQSLRERFATLNDVDREAADGDFVVIDLSASADGEVLDGAQTAGLSYQIGHAMLTGLDEALTGMSTGDEKTFASQLVGGDQAGLDVELEVKVSAVKVQELPELDDDFAQDASEFDTVEELLEDVRQRLGRGKRLEQAAAARDGVLEALLSRISVPLPDALVAGELAARRETIEAQLAQAGMSMQAYLDSEEQTVDEFDRDLDESVRNAVTAQFVLDEVAKKEAIGVDQAELSEHLFRRAQQTGQNPDEFVKHMVEHNHIPDMVSEVVRGKALAAVVDSAVVSDESGNHVELKLLQPDGTVLEAAEVGEAEGVGEPAEVREAEEAREPERA